MGLTGSGADEPPRFHTSGALRYYSRALWRRQGPPFLRQQQGTLYGRNATAGVINVIHREPGEEAEGYVNLKIGNFNRYDAEAAYGGPPGESAGFRLAVRYGSDGGFTEDLDPTGGDEVDGGETSAVRATLKFALSDTISVKLIGDWTDFDGDNRTIRPRGNLHRSAARSTSSPPTRPTPGPASAS